MKPDKDAKASHVLLVSKRFNEVRNVLKFSPQFSQYIMIS